MKHRILLCILNLLIILKSEIIEVADRSGLSNLDVEFNPASKSGLQVINVMISLKDGAVILINNRTTDPSFQNWFTSICLLLADRVNLIPDTNFIRRTYYSNYIKDILIKNLNIIMQIPRLGIIEGENIYNCNKAVEKQPVDLFKYLLLA